MSSRKHDIALYLSTGMLIMTCFTIVYLDSFLLFHTLAELFSIIIGFSIFIITWNSRKYISNQYILYLGIAFLCICLLDVLHLLSYQGMPFFQGHGSDLPTQLWIASRYILALALLSAPVMMKNRVNINILFTVFLIVTIGAVFFIFTDHFPACYIEGKGLTEFKKVSEYVISLLYIASIFLLVHFRDKFDRYVLVLIICSIIFAILSELCFTLYLSVYGFSNFAGHFFKIVSFMFLYRAIIVTGLKNPYSLLFRELNEQREEYRSLFEHMIDGFARHTILTDGKGRPVDYSFDDVNYAFEKLTGLKKADIVGKKVTEILPGMKNDPVDWIGIYGNVATTGKSIRFENYSGDLKKWFSIAAYSTKKGNFTTVFQDITERKQLEETLERKVEERTRELEERNQELQDFSFIASHDLQEPLRKIRTFGNMVSEKLRTGSPDQVVDYISRMIDSAEKMQNLLRSLLAYSRVTTARQPFHKIDLSMVLVDALSNLEILIKEKEAVIEISSLPTIDADPSQITQVFQNLIGNALKFCNPGEVPHISIHCESADEETCRIAVKDKGIGFDIKYISKIFMPFQRLNGIGEYPGTGMGLAICKKIIERHGGQITASSRVGSGATFTFTLPVKHTDEWSI